MIDRQWRVRTADPDLVRLFRRELDVRTVTARILAGRGATDVETARVMLDAGRGITHTPEGLPQIDRALCRLVQAYERQEKVSVYGDYDADGQTAAALMVLGFGRLGMEVDYYIPHRLDEGYGLNMTAVAALAEKGVDLLITVDCGTTAVTEVAEARALGIDCIVTDHHEAVGPVADALAVVNPKLPDTSYPWPHLAGVGVAYKLMTALGERLGRPHLVADLEDLVAFGTIADVVPLQDENRVLVYRGLQKLNTSPLPGLAALAAVSELAPGAIEAHHVAFQMAPRLNAAGRMADASMGMDMLLASSLEDALPLGVQLDQANRARQEEEERVLAEAQLVATDEIDSPVLTIMGAGWHPGVVGIVASRLVDLFGRPALVLTDEDGLVTGSGRSVPGFHITEALARSSHLLIRYGGHAMAAGLSLETKNIESLREALNEEARRQFGDEGRARLFLDIDARVEPLELDTALLTELKSLGPFGYGNPSPVLAWAEVTPCDVRVVGKDKSHLRLTLPVGRSEIAAFGFRLGHKAEKINGPQDLAFTLTLNEWQGRTTLEMRLRDLQPSVCAKAMNEAAATSESLATGGGEIPIFLATATTRDWRDCAIRATQRGLSPVIWALHPEATADDRMVVVWPEGPIPSSPTEPWVLILCGPPVAEDWLRVWSALTAKANPAEVHVLYGAGEVAKARALVDADWPERQGLVRAYLELRRLASHNQPLTPEKVAQGSSLSRSGSLLAMRIFEELGLLSQSGNRWDLMPEPGDKLDLSWAVSYNECMVKRAEVARLFVARQSGQALARWLERGLT